MLGAILLVFGFIFFITIFDLAGKSRRVFKVSQEAFAIVRNAEISDEEKEKATQNSSKELFSLFFLIIFICGVAIFVPVGLIWLLEKVGLFDLQNVIDRTLSWQFILASTIIIVIALWIKRRK